MFTMSRDDRARARLDAFAHPRYGATATAAPDELERAVRQVARGEPYLSHRLDVGLSSFSSRVSSA